MKRLVAISTIASGILLIIVPRYVLPACGYVGYPSMHCTYTARAEYVLGAILIAIGGMTLLLKFARSVFIFSVFAFVVYCFAFYAPDIYGYCLSPRMPCNYGMVPGVRFISAAGAVIMLFAAVNIFLRNLKKKGAS